MKKSKEFVAPVTPTTQPDWLTIATLICLKCAIEHNGKQVLPGELAKFMSDVAEQAGVTPTPPTDPPQILKITRKPALVTELRNLGTELGDDAADCIEGLLAAPGSTSGPGYSKEYLDDPETWRGIGDVASGGVPAGWEQNPQSNASSGAGDTRPPLRNEPLAINKSGGDEVEGGATPQPMEAQYLNPAHSQECQLRYVTVEQAKATDYGCTCRAATLMEQSPQPNSVAEISHSHVQLEQSRGEK